LRKGLFTGSEKDGVGVRSSLFGERGDVQTPKADKRATRAIVVGDAVRAIGVRDVDLDDDEVGGIIQSKGLDMLVDDGGAVVDR